MIDAKKPHDIAVSHQGPGADDWMFYCSCGVSGVLESEDLADARAEAHRNELKPRPPEPSFSEAEVREILNLIDWDLYKRREVEVLMSKKLGRPWEWQPKNVEEVG